MLYKLVMRPNKDTAWMVASKAVPLKEAQKLISKASYSSPPQYDLHDEDGNSVLKKCWDKVGGNEPKVVKGRNGKCTHWDCGHCMKEGIDRPHGCIGYSKCDYYSKVVKERNGIH